MSEQSLLQSSPGVSGYWRKRAIICILVLLAGLGGYSGWWWLAAAQLEKGIQGWIDMRRAEGVVVGYESLQINGFPQLIRVRVQKPKAEPIKGDFWSWQGNTLSFQARPWNFSRVSYDLSGPQSGNLLLKGKIEPFTFRAKTLAGDVTLKKGRLNTVRSQGKDIVFQLSNYEDVIAISDIETTLAQSDNHLINLDTRLRDLRISQLSEFPLGERVRHLRVKAALPGWLPRNRNIDALARWRDEGGKIDITSLDLGYGAVQVTGDGSFVLDSTLQPAGNFSARVVGISGALDAVQQNGLIGPRDAMAVKLAVGVLSKTPEGGGDRYLDVPVKIQNRTVQIGPFKLKPFPAINW